MNKTIMKITEDVEELGMLLSHIGYFRNPEGKLWLFKDNEIHAVTKEDKEQLIKENVALYTFNPADFVNVLEKNIQSISEMDWTLLRERWTLNSLRLFVRELETNQREGVVNLTNESQIQDYVAYYKSKGFFTDHSDLFQYTSNGKYRKFQVEDMWDHLPNIENEILKWPRNKGRIRARLPVIDKKTFDFWNLLNRQGVSIAEAEERLAKIMEDLTI